MTESSNAIDGRAAAVETTRSAPGRGPGLLVVIEGIDGAGKTTLAGGVAARLRERGLSVLLSQEPTDGPHGRQLRQSAAEPDGRLSPEEELELFVADRRDHVREVIAPALRAGKIVLLDRYYYSTVAYQGARGISIRRILDLHAGFAPEPDLLVILRLEVAKALERIRAARPESADSFEQAAYLTSVATIFDHVIHPNLLWLDAERPPEALAEDVVAAVGACLAAADAR